MNERIRELAEQAVDHALSVCDANGVYQGKEYLSVVKEKFAELIVKECAELANEETSLPYDSYSEKIKRHFGVEE